MDAPVLLRIPFSHFCKKAEWGLTQAGVPYETRDMLPRTRMRLEGLTAGTVPVMLDGDTVVDGSDAILRWASAHAAHGTPALYPSRHRRAIERWEQWAGEAIGPVARREAYRVWYHHPDKLTDRWWVHVLARRSRGLALGVMKYYKARRFDDEDPAAIKAAFSKISKRIRANGTGYLYGDGPTAADVTTAALSQPFLYAAPGRDYAALEGWHDVVGLVERVKPERTTRRRRRRMREKDWRRLKQAVAGQAA